MPKFKLEPAIREPLEIGTELGEVYWYWKDAEAMKEDLRKEFFGACKNSFSEQDLATKTVLTPEDIKTEEDAFAYALKYNPGWEIVDTGEPDQGLDVVIREDPNFKPVTLIILTKKPVEDRNGKPHPGYVVQKTIAGGSALVDDARLKVIEPEFYNKITEWRGQETLADMLYNSGVDADEIDERLATWLGGANWDRVLRKDLNPAQTERLRDYSYEGPKTIKLNVRYAKDDETPGA